MLSQSSKYTTKVILSYLIKILIALVAVAIVLVAVGYYFGQIRFSENNTENKRNESVTELFVGLNELKNNDATSQERLSYVLEQRAGLQGDLGVEELASVEVYAANLSLRSNPEEALNIYFDLYTNEKYTSIEWLRDRVLYDVMLFATEVGSPRLGFEQAKNLIFAPSRFGPIVGVSTETAFSRIETEEDIKRLTSIGLDVVTKSLPVGPQRLRLRAERDVMRISVLLNELYKVDVPPRFTSDVAQASFTQSGTAQEDLLWIQASVDDFVFGIKESINLYQEYSANIVYTLNFAEKLYIDFLFLGFDTKTQIQDVRDTLHAYVVQHEDGTLFAKNRSALISATADMFYACSLVIEDDPVLTVEKKAEVQTNISNILNLPKEQIKQHSSPLVEYANNPHYSCYEAFILIGREIEPAFKEFLINDVGGWTYSQFE